MSGTVTPHFCDRILKTLWEINEYSVISARHRITSVRAYPLV
jgi:hypothetical protein